MQTALQHLSAVELEQGLPDVLASPRDNGRLAAIVVRPAANERLRLMSAALSPENGIEGDRWIRDIDPRSPNGRPDPLGQVSLMNARFLRQIAGEEDAISLAGDNLIVDLDLSEENLPPGSRLAIGDSVVVEINGEPHTGCGKFQKRYGAEARTFMNNERGISLHLRGRFGSIVTGGSIAVGDAVRALA
jgi:MOSC domain-containing protein YiiM